MSRPTRPTSRALAGLATACLVGALVSCSSDAAPSSDASATPSGSESASPSESPSPTSTVAPEVAFANIAVKGKQGQAPKVTWSGKVEVDATVTDTLIQGKGTRVADGDQVFANVWIGNGSTQKEAYSSYATTPTPLITVGPSTLPALNQALTGHRVGDRVLVAAPPADVYGPNGNDSLGLGPADTTVLVVDLVGTLPDKPSGTQETPASWAPKIVETDGAPSALDFAGTPKPGTGLKRTFVIRGKGPRTQKGDHLYVNYLGQIYGGDQPFDMSYGRQTFDFDLGAGNVVAGWDQGLAGVPVGSRVILAIPPSLGYGDAGQPDVGITGTDTMYFVVDVLARA